MVGCLQLANCATLAADGALGILERIPVCRPVMNFHEAGKCMDKSVGSRYSRKRDNRYLVSGTLCAF